MSYRSFFFGLTLAGCLMAAGSIHAAQGSHNRDPHVCLDGPNIGLACTDNSQCPQSKCAVDYLKGSGTTFHAELYIIADDDVSKWDGSEEVSSIHAVTVLLKTRYRGTEYLLAQTYQNLENSSALATFITALQTGPILADTHLSRGPVDEEKLNDALDEGFIGNDPTKSLLDDILWQGGDSQIADELRSILGVVGNPILVKPPARLAAVRHSDYEANGLASVVRLRVTFRFVAP